MPMKYSCSMRQEVTLEYSKGCSVRELARRYEPCAGTIRKWIQSDDEMSQRLESTERELTHLRKKYKQQTQELLILEKGNGLNRDPAHRTISQVREIYRFMQSNQAAKIFTIAAMCRAFQVSQRAYYGWRQRQLKRETDGTNRREQRIKSKLRALHIEHRGAYGVNRMTASLKLWYPEIGRRRVYRYMKELGIQGKTRRRKWRTTIRDLRPHGIQDHVKRDFSARMPRQLVVCDATCVPLRRGRAYLATSLDVFSRKIVGWAIDEKQSAGLMVRVLQQALTEGPCLGMVCHSDQGSQYTSNMYKLFCKEHGIQQSTGSVGNCFDNAMAESFFATLKTECIGNQRFESVEDAEREIGEYINNYYNEERFHSGIGYRIPNEVEHSYQIHRRSTMSR